MTTTLSVRIDALTRQRLESLAKRSRRSKSSLAAEAVASYVETESWQLDEIAESRPERVWSGSSSPARGSSTSRSQHDVRVIGDDGDLTSGQVLPGFRCAVGRLFP